jgi:hypothetical protein
MSSRRNRNKKAQTSAAKVLSESDGDNSSETVLTNGAYDRERDTLWKTIDRNSEATEKIKSTVNKIVNTLEKYNLILMGSGTDNDGGLVGTVNKHTKMVSEQNEMFKKALHEIIEIKAEDLVKHNMQQSAQGPTDENIVSNLEVAQLLKENQALKTEMQQIRNANQTLQINLDATKCELRSLKDEFLMNLERQNEDTLVIHGISESEGESTSGLEEEVNRIISTNLSITTPCAEAYRIGKKGPSPRVIKVRWDNQKHCRVILEKHKKLPDGIYVNKDRPFILREVRRKIREKAKELWSNNIEYDYRDLGLFYNGKFHHYTELELSTKKSGKNQHQRDGA